MSKIKVGIKKVGEDVVFTEIEHTLEELQKNVGGYIDMFRTDDLAEYNIDIILNDEGKLMGLKPNVAIADEEQNRVIDLIVGDIIFAAFDEEGNTLGLTERQCSYIKTSLSLAETTWVDGDDSSIRKIPVMFY